MYKPTLIMAAALFLSSQAWATAPVTLKEQNNTVTGQGGSASRIGCRPQDPNAEVRYTCDPDPAAVRALLEKQKQGDVKKKNNTFSGPE